VFQSRGLISAVFAVALLCPPSARADITEDFANAVAAEAAAAAAGTDLRKIPDDAIEGIMFRPQGRLVAIDDKLMMLAPGSKIRDLNNRIIMPSAITAPVNVRYTVDQYAHVHLVWLMGGDVELPEKNKGNPAEN